MTGQKFVERRPLLFFLKIMGVVFLQNFDFLIGMDGTAQIFTNCMTYGIKIIFPYLYLKRALLFRFVVKQMKCFDNAYPANYSIVI